MQMAIVKRSDHKDGEKKFGVEKRKRESDGNMSDAGGTRLGFFDAK